MSSPVKGNVKADFSQSQQSAGEAAIYEENWRILGILYEEEYPSPVVNDAFMSWNLWGHPVQTNGSENATPKKIKKNIPESPKSGSGGNPPMAVTGESSSDQCDTAEIE